MSKIARYQGNVPAFASDAQGLERTVFGGTNQADDLTSQITASFLRGWGIVGASEHPSLEDFNAAMYAMSQFIAYQHQMGVPEWHSEQEYHIGSICTHDGESYQSLQDANVGSPPPSAKWTPVLTSKNGLANLRIVDATTSQKGLVRLNSGVTNESNEEAATPGAVKIAYDAAMNAFNLAKTKYTADGATTAIAGLVQLVNSMGVSNALVMPQAAVTTAIQTYPSLGKGQTLQDLRGSRGVGVTYTNSSGFPIAVYVRITGSTSANLYAYVDGKEYGGGGSTALQTAIATAFFIVPNNTSYRVDATGVSNVLQAWTELR